MSFKDFRVIRYDRPYSSQGGGTAILINKDLNFSQVYLNLTKHCKILELTVINIPCKEGMQLMVGSIYAPPNNKVIFAHEMNEIFEEFKLDNPKNYYVLAGDFNVRRVEWGDPNSNTRGGYFLNWIKNNGIEY